jgi:hypothetical protein
MLKDIPCRQCFVGLFDILGFSNMVKNDQLKYVWKSYKDIKSSTTFIKENLESLLDRKIVNIDTFSDTFLIYTADHRDKGQEDIDEYFNAMLGVCDALFHSANSNRIPIRGAITVGELIVDEGVLLGKPIVEAYEMEQNQNWMGCWISDAAFECVSKQLQDRHMNGNLILKYKIPLKKGDIKEYYAFNCADSFSENNWEHGFFEVKSNHDWRSEQKHRNTRDFIKFMRNSIRDKKAVEQLNSGDTKDSAPD